MSYRGPVARWDLFLADLDFPVGSEQGGEARPVLVVSNDGFNAHFPLVTILPLTKLEGKRRRVYAFEVEMRAGLAGNPLDSIVMPQQVRTIDKARLQKRIGELADTKVRAEIEDKLLQHLGIAFDDEDDGGDN